MDSMLLTCPSCGKQLKAPASFAGDKYRCAGCDSINLVKDSVTPSAESPPPPEPSPAAQPPPAESAPPEPSPPDEQPPPVEQPPPTKSTPTIGSSGFRPQQDSKSRAAEMIAMEDTLAAAHKTGFRFFRWAFLFTLIPLIWYSFWGQKEKIPFETVEKAFREQLESRLEEDESLKEKWESLEEQGGAMERMLFYANAFGDDEAVGFLKELEGKMKDAEPLRQAIALNALEAQLMKIYSGLQTEPEPFLSEETWAHWGLGAVAALVFLLYFCFAYPRNDAKPVSLFMVGVLTDTIGVFMLLALQWLSGMATSFRMRGRGILVLLWLILIAIASLMPRPMTLPTALC